MQRIFDFLGIENKTAHPSVPIITERNCIIFLLAMFLLLAGLVATMPYEPMEMDLADATTNVIWVENYTEGIHHIPVDDWEFRQTQSVVVEHEGELVVVNEKGPGLVAMIVPFHILGIEALFGPIMVGLALLGTYMLGKRLLNWRAGFIGALLVLSNVTVIVMWHRYYWTDAATMHLMILSAWLLVEANYRYNGGLLNPRKPSPSNKKAVMWGAVFGLLSGLAFGAAVSTRYPTAMLVFGLLAYLFIFYFIRALPDLKKKDIKAVIRGSRGFFILLAVFAVGLFLVLVPLMNYNSQYFGGPFNSGYDATSLKTFWESGNITARNSTSEWTGSLFERVSIAIDNFFTLLPNLIMRMPGLLFVPLGIWLMRKRHEVLLLTLIIGINFFTYLSIEWIDMYTRLGYLEALWEPRYFMPALPFIGILAGAGIERFVAGRDRLKAKLRKLRGGVGNTRSILAAIVLVIMLMLVGLVPAASYISQDGILADNRGPTPRHMSIVTTDQLIAAPNRFLDDIVKVENAEVVHINLDAISIRSQNAQNSGSVVALYPRNGAPDYAVGDIITVEGMFVYEDLPIVTGYVIHVAQENGGGQQPPPPQP